MFFNYFLIASVSASRIRTAEAYHTVQSGAYRPVVLMHGLGASAESMSHAQGWIEADFPGIYTHNVEIGNGKDSSFFMNINLQVDEFAQTVKKDPNLAQGFNLIGHSQGGLIGRAYIERYNSPPVFNFMSWAGPMAGVYGVPDFNAICPDAECPWLNEIFSWLLEGKYEALQDHISFAAYWRDPLNATQWAKTNNFLADINNMLLVKNPNYRNNMISLNQVQLLHTSADFIVVPKVSPWFEFFADGSDSAPVPFKQTDTYLGDWIGLQTLDKAGKIQLQMCNCSHQDIPRDDCKYVYDKWTVPLLNNTLP